MLLAGGGAVEDVAAGGALSVLQLLQGGVELQSTALAAAVTV